MEIGVPSPIELTAQPPVPFKNRRGWLIAFGVIQVLIACCCLVIVACVVSDFITLMLPNRPVGAPEPSPIDLVCFLIGGGLTVLFLILGVGSIKCKSWAPLASRIVSGLWLFTGVVVSLVLLLAGAMIVEPQDHFQPEKLHLVTLVAVLVMVIVPATLLVFYSVKSVRATCGASAHQAQARRPFLSVERELKR